MDTPESKQPHKARPGDNIPVYRGEEPSTTVFGTAAPAEIPPRGPIADDHPTTVIPAQPAPRPQSEPPVVEQPTTTIPVVTPDPAVPAAMQAVPAEPLLAQPAVAAVPVDTVADKRGTIDFGLFILRVFFGALLVFNAATVLFDLNNTGGLGALEKSFQAYAYPQLLAIGVTSVELAAGVFIVLGLLTPFAAAFSVLATSFLALHAIYISDNTANPVFWEDSIWLSLILVAIGVAIQFTGPGRISFDFTRSWAKRPLVSSWVFFVLGVAGAIALWIVGTGINPLA